MEELDTLRELVCLHYRLPKDKFATERNHDMSLARQLFIFIYMQQHGPTAATKRVLAQYLGRPASYVNSMYANFVSKCSTGALVKSITLVTRQYANKILAAEADRIRKLINDANAGLTYQGKIVAYDRFVDTNKMIVRI